MKFRVTLNDQYRNPSCVGHKDLSARNGHYYHADSLEDALIAAKRNHGQVSLTVQVWNFGLDHGKVVYSNKAGDLFRAPLPLVGGDSRPRQSLVFFLKGRDLLAQSGAFFP